MGLYNILKMNSGEEIQFRWGNCDLSTYRIGDTIKWNDIGPPSIWSDDNLNVSGIGCDNYSKKDKFYQIEIRNNVISSVTPISEELFNLLDRS